MLSQKNLVAAALAVAFAFVAISLDQVGPATASERTVAAAPKAG